MHLNQKEASSSSISATFFRYTLPAVAAMIVNGLYQLVDGMFVGYFLGAEGLKAINIAWPVVGIIAGLGLMVGMGGGSLISIYRGSERLIKARSTFFTALLLSVVFGGLASLYLLFFGEYLIDVQGALGEAKGYAREYIDVFLFGAVFTVLSSSLPFLIRNDDSPLFATGMMLVGALTNIALDYVFIGIFGWGLEGAGIATVFAQITTVFLACIYLVSPYSYLSLFKHPLKAGWKEAKKSLALGLSSLTMFMYYGLLVGFHNRLFAEYGSSVSVAAFAVVGYLMTIYYVIAEGVAEGIQPQVSFYHGAKQFDNILKVVKLGCFVTVAAGMTWLLVLNLFPEPIIGLFNSTNSDLIHEATLGIRFHLSTMYLDGLIILASMYFLSVGKGGVSLCISAGNILVQFPFLALLPTIWGVNGVWLSMPLSNVLIILIVFPVMWRDILKQKKSLDQVLV